MGYRSACSICDKTLNDNLVSYSNKEKVVAKSGVEAECRSLAIATAEATCVHNLLIIVGKDAEKIACLILPCDN